MDDGECEQSKLLGLRNVTSVIQQLAPVHDVLSLTLSWKIISHIKALEPYHQILAISNFNVDQVLINALAECYNSANSWESRRQILSIMADKVAFSTLKKWIPDLTRYRFRVARRHALTHGRCVHIPRIKQTKMFVSPIQLDHFLDVTTSPYVIQDVPFGQKSIELSMKEIVKVPNVIRMLIPNLS